ncbi:MAG: trpF [Geminicoccaceae bacterium]|nr:trpF [Geminicoccaceae bacterium]
MRRTRIKICCMQSEKEARLAIAAGADALGLVGTMPSGPGPIGDALIAAIAARVPPPVATLLLTSETGAEAIFAHASRCRTNTLQLVDRVEPADYPRLRRALPGIKLVQVVHVGGEAAVAEAIAAAAHADALLLDSGRPHEPIKVLGGTGRTHDWAISREIVDRAACPVFLAGGLRADNVTLAIQTVRPFGVDVCTGVRRADYTLDPVKLEAFVAAVQATPV